MLARTNTEDVVPEKITDLIEMTNKMQLCRTIYYSIVP